MATQPAKTNILELLEKGAASEAEASKADAKPEGKGKKKGGKKVKRTLLKARVCIACGENNTIVTITDPNGGVIAWASAGSAGFKGARKSTPYAAKVAAERAMGMVSSFGIQHLDIEVKGIGPGREQAIRGLQVSGVNFDSIRDRTPVAHGGCRAPKPRRI